MKDPCHLPTLAVCSNPQVYNTGPSTLPGASVSVSFPSRLSPGGAEMFQVQEMMVSPPFARCICFSFECLLEICIPHPGTYSQGSGSLTDFTLWRHTRGNPKKDLNFCVETTWLVPWDLGRDGHELIPRGGFRELPRALCSPVRVNRFLWEEPLHV